MSKKTKNPHDPRRVQKPHSTRPVRQYKLDSRSVGLAEVYELSRYNQGLTSARMFSCDITETRIAGGAPTKVGVPTLLFGLNTNDDILGSKTYTVTPNEFGRRDPLQLLENGVMQLSFGRWASSPISFQESFRRSEQAKHLRNHVAVLITSDDPEIPGAVTSDLYYRVLLRTTRNQKIYWEPIWLLYSWSKKNPCLSHKDARVLMGELNEDHCIHKFEFFGHTGWKTIREVTERCAFCDEKRTRKPTRAEQAANTRSLKQIDKLHDIYHKVCKRLEGLDGYEAMEEAEKLAKKYKDHVQYVSCDDNDHTNSALLLVDHENDDCYMGTSVIYLPQCAGTRATFFLYPGDRGELMNALEIVKHKAATHT